MDSECPVTKSWTAAWSAANCEAPEQSGLLPLPARTLQPSPSSFVRPSKSKRSQQLQSWQFVSVSAENGTSEHIPKVAKMIVFY